MIKLAYQVTCKKIKLEHYLIAILEGKVLEKRKKSITFAPEHHSRIVTPTIINGLKRIERRKLYPTV